MDVVSNPMGFRCAPNESTPDYVVYDDFRRWLAYGLVTCWLSGDANDPNADCNMARPVTRDDVRELRGYFLDAVETVVGALWREQLHPGYGYVQGDFQSLIIAQDDEDSDTDETVLQWAVRLDNDAMMFELFCSGADPVCIWLSYDAIKDRQRVVAALQEARRVSPAFGKDGAGVWDGLLELAK